MAKKYGSLSFPFTQDILTQSLKRTTDINSTIKAAMLCFLLTEPGQRRGNVVGSMLSSLKQKTIPSNSLPGIADEIKNELIENFPGVTILDVKLSQNFDDNVINLNCNISFQTSISEIEELKILI